MKVIKFYLEDEDSLIIIDAKINDYDVRLALDTGASHTVVDLTSLMIAGFQKSDVLENTLLETGKGAVEAEVYLVNAFETLGIVNQNFKTCSYDFLANGILAPIDGVLGLDFLKVRKNKICIDFEKSEITIHEGK